LILSYVYQTWWSKLDITDTEAV